MSDAPNWRLLKTIILNERAFFSARHYGLSTKADEAISSPDSRYVIFSAQSVKSAATQPGVKRYLSYGFHRFRRG